MKLLSIDWDFFFPVPRSDPQGLFDWGHQENPFFRTTIWPVRASSFLAADLPLPPLSGEQTACWDRFRIAEGAPLYVADSHALIAADAIVAGVDEVWSFDAHHDLGYERDDLPRLFATGTIRCDTWGLAYGLYGIGVHVRFPTWARWRDDVASLLPLSRQVLDAGSGSIAVETNDERLPIFDKVFLCRSGCWVPPWHDEAFTDLVGRFPGHQVIESRTLPGAADDDGVLPRDFPLEEVTALTDATRNLRLSRA